MDDGRYLRNVSALAMALTLSSCTSATGKMDFSPGDGEGTGATGTGSNADPGGSGATTGDTDTAGDDADDGIRYDVASGSDVGGGEEIDPTESCEAAAQARTSIGCEFYSLHFKNWGTTPDVVTPHSVAVANVHEDREVNVTLEVRQPGGAWAVVEGPVVLSALTLYVFEHTPPVNEAPAVVAGAAIRVTSDEPVVAYQFAPLDGGSMSSDASLLYPTTSWDHLNLGTAFVSSANGPADIGLMAGHDGTIVEVFPSVDVGEGNGIPAGQGGASFVIEMDAGDTAVFRPDVWTLSLSGTFVQSQADKPVAVFSTHECAVLGGGCCCDHVEEQVPGLRAWGTEIVAPQMPIRNVASAEATAWEIYGSEDGTTVTFDAAPGVSGLPAGPIALDRGDSHVMTVGGAPGVDADFVVNADKPVLVKSFLTTNSASGLAQGDPRGGDPAMAVVPPAEQFLSRQVVLVPDNWEHDFLVVLRRAAHEVLLDGVPVPDADFSPAGGGTWEVARVSVADGVHVLDGGEEPVGVVVVGFDAWDSYAYTGGTGAATINPNPTPPEG
jgi:hypothetical protein